MFYFAEGQHDILHSIFVFKSNYKRVFSAVSCTHFCIVTEVETSLKNCKKNRLKQEDIDIDFTTFQF